MKLKKTLLLSLYCLAFTACTHLPTQPQKSQLLEQVQNIQVLPETQSNQARLLKYQDTCIIEFTGKLGTGQAVEQWSFKGNQLLSANTHVLTQEGTRKVTHFDLQDPSKQANFVALRNNFHYDKLIQCY